MPEPVAASGADRSGCGAGIWFAWSRSPPSPGLLFCLPSLGATRWRISHRFHRRAVFIAATLVSDASLFVRGLTP